MPDDLETFGVLVRDDRDAGVAADHVRGVDDLAVDLAGQRGLREAGTDGRGDVPDGNGTFELTDGAVGKLDGNHGADSQNEKSADAMPHFFIETGMTTGVRMRSKRD